VQRSPPENPQASPRQQRSREHPPMTAQTTFSLDEIDVALAVSR